MALSEYFSVIALFILFRETVEASIIVAVLLQFLNRSFPHLKRQVWWGVFCGLVVSVAFGVAFSIVFYVFKNNVFTGANQAIFKGCIAWFAAILITVLAFIMLQYKGWEDKIKRKLEGMAEKELEMMRRGDVEEPVPQNFTGKVRYHTRRSCTAIWAPVGRGAIVVIEAVDRAVDSCYHGIARGCRSACRCLPCERLRPGPEKPKEAEKEMTPEELAVTRGHGVGIFLIVFSTVMREGIESVIFLAGVGNSKPISLILPGIIGLLCGISVGLFLYYTGKQVKDIRWFVIIMSVILFFVAAGQIMLGTNYLTNGGMFGTASVWVNERPWYMQPAWDISSCCAITNDNSQQFWVLAQAIVGYQDKPTYLQIIFYFSYWGLILAIGAYRWWRGSLFDADYKMTRQRKLEAEQQAKLEAQLQLATDPDVLDLATAKKLAAEESKDLESQTTDSGDGGRGSPTQSQSQARAAVPAATAAEASTVQLLPPAVQTAETSRAVLLPGGDAQSGKA